MKKLRNKIGAGITKVLSKLDPSIRCPECNSKKLVKNIAFKRVSVTKNEKSRSSSRSVAFNTFSCTSCNHYWAEEIKNVEKV